MTEDHNKLQKEHDESHEETLKLLLETEESLKTVQITIMESRERLSKATKKYQERLYGPTNSGRP